VGDPEWIGVLQHPDQPYGPNNPFVARYAYIALPIGNALDLNAIYDDAMGIRQTTSMSPGNDGFLRNEGVGSWEINLAAFLADLNINQWDTIANPYTYREPGSAIPNTGAAFDDALSLLSYRYDYFYNGSYNLASVNKLFGGAGSAASVAFRNDNIDGYSDGPLQTGFPLPGDITTPQQNDNPSLPWSGADNTNQFFDLQELFNTNETAVGVAPALVAAGNDFTGRLLNAGTNFSTYDRYTYYRLASQLGVESAPEQDKMNLNYDNLDPGANGVLTANGTASATNFVPWQPLTFFTNAADRMLRDYSQEWLVENPSNYVATFNLTTNIGTLAFPTNMPVPFGISSIPVWVSNQFVYTPAVQRVLQLAANIYDATTNNTAVMGANFPSVFRPTFLVTRDPVSGYTNVYINGYEQVVSVVGTGDFQLNLPVNVSDLLTPPSYGFGVWTNVNVYGVPWIVGAKKGFPNFNEFSMESVVAITRRLQVTRLAINPPRGTPDFANFHTNQMYTMCISNLLGVECWNSYTNNYTPVSAAGLTIVVNDNLSMTLTNENGVLAATGNLPLDYSYNIPSSQFWPGVLPWDGDGHPNPQSFIIPMLTDVIMQLNSAFLFTTNWWAYSFDARQFVPAPSSPLYETDVPGFPLPHFGLQTTNRLQVYMLDGNHVIDYAQFAGPDTARDLNAEIFTDDNNGVWNTNASTVGPPVGIENQLGISSGSTPLQINEDGNWHADPEAAMYGGSIADQQAYDDAFFEPGNKSISTSGKTVSNTQLTNQVPYDPTRYSVLYTTWQANDPLVHYTASDLNYTLPTGGALSPGTNTFNYGQTIPTLADTNGNLGQLNNHYKPWGRSLLAPGTDTNAYNIATKDPLVWQSQDWDFPTNKFPTVGWLGRVHRGTPWQTVYLKSPNILSDVVNPFGPVGTNTWAQWTGDTMLTTNSPQYYDAVNSAPVQDRLLFDNFTTAFDDNATRGQLSVNVGASDPNNPQAGLAAWSALFSGVEVVSNNATSTIISAFDPLPQLGLQRNGLLTNFFTSPINPAGPAGQSSALGGLVADINAVRTGFVNGDGLKGAFEHVGDILAVPQLSDKSLFLNWNDTAQQANGISDEMYEWLPQQVMSLLRVSGTPQSPMRYVIYSYGQALKPAPNGIYTGSGPLFGMITNYQVVAESATRTVLRYNGNRTDVIGTLVTNDAFGNTVANWVVVPSITNNNVMIERFNVLPPN
jgi:hypothetical protein